MKLLVDLEEALLTPERLRRGKLSVLVRWDFDGIYYPALVWFESGVEVVFFWICCAIRLARGATSEIFHFMEGDFRLDVRRADSRVQVSPHGWDRSWEIEFDAFAAELLAAADRIVSELGSRGESDAYFHRLKEMRELLEKELAAK